MRETDSFYLRHQEPVRGCLLALRGMISGADDEVTEAWKFNMPFFCFRNKMFCYLWVDPKTGHPYIGIVEGKRIKHPDLVIGKRTRMKILYVDPEKDLPHATIMKILRMTLDLYKKGVIKTPQKK